MEEELLDRLLRERDEARKKTIKLQKMWEILKEKVCGEVSACRLGSSTALSILDRMIELEKER